MTDFQLIIFVQQVLLLLCPFLPLLHVAQVCLISTETSKSESLSMSDSFDKINFSSRVFKASLSRYVNLLSILNFEFHLEFKKLVVFIGLG